MILFVLLGFLAFTSAAPHYHHHHHGHGPPSPFPHHDDFSNRFYQDDLFDVRSFWDALQQELLNIDRIYEQFGQHFPSTVSSEKIDGNMYKITITLLGFEEKEITVKAKKGFVMIQAVHESGDNVIKSYLDMRSLPDYVSEAGKWRYKNDVLTIEFPLIEQPSDSTTEIVTEAPHSREEMDPKASTDSGESNENVDVGADRGDLGKEAVLLTNEVSRPRTDYGVEATTYAVDLKDEVEFVPIIPKRQVK